MEAQLLDLVSARRGHFRLESGHHGNLWLDLDSLFLRPALLLPFARELARRLAAHRVEAVVGGVSYRLPDTLRDQLAGREVAIVDDAVNAGSATRSTFAALTALGARPVAVGALLVLGDTALPFLSANDLPLESVARLDNELWQPATCPLCAAGVPLNSPSDAG